MLTYVPICYQFSWWFRIGFFTWHLGRAVWGRGIETPGHSSICSAGRVNAFNWFNRIQQDSTGQCCAKCIEAIEAICRLTIDHPGCCVEIHLLLWFSLSVSARSRDWPPRSICLWSTFEFIIVEFRNIPYSQWIGLRENLQESPIFNGKIYGFL